MQETFSSPPDLGRVSADVTQALQAPKGDAAASKPHSRFRVLDSVETEKRATHEVFVYGSLLPGLHNHGLLEGAWFLGYRKTYPDFEMFSLGHFPAVCAEGKTAIYGALYQVDDDTLRMLDQLESHPQWYRRETVNLVPSDLAPARHQAWMYLMPRTEPEIQNNWVEPVQSGDWFAYHNDQEAKASARAKSAGTLHTVARSPFAVAG